MVGNRDHELPLDASLERASAKLRVISLVDHPLHCRGVDRQNAAAMYEPIATKNIIDQSMRDLADLLARKRFKGNDPVDAVEEFRQEESLGRIDKHLMRRPRAGTETK